MSVGLWYRSAKSQMVLQRLRPVCAHFLLELRLHPFHILTEMLANLHYLFHPMIPAVDCIL